MSELLKDSIFFQNKFFIAQTASDLRCMQISKFYTQLVTLSPKVKNQFESRIRRIKYEWVNMALTLLNDMPFKVFIDCH